MLMMLELRNETHIVFFDMGQKKEAERFRRAHPEFKGRKIQPVIQATPSWIPRGVKMEVK